MYPIRDFTASGSRTTSTPATRAVPEVGSKSPQRIRMVVVLPEPFGPRMPKISPGKISKETSSTATIRPKRRVIERTSTTGVRTKVPPPATAPAPAPPPGSAAGKDSGIGRQPGLQEPVLGIERHLHAEHDIRALLF